MPKSQPTAIRAGNIHAPDGTPANRWALWMDIHGPRLMVLPTVLVLLAFSIFPLLTSAYLAVSKFSLAPGGYSLRFVGFRNFKKLLIGSEQYHFLGTFAAPTPVEWSVFGVVVALSLYGLWRYLASGNAGFVGLVGRLFTAIMVVALTALVLLVIDKPGFPGTLVVTLFYVFAGVALQFALGLGLALICAQAIAGRNFFRVVFFIPLMVTPVGVAYAFRMLADMGKGPFSPLWQMFGLAELSWATNPWSARLVVLLGDTWQWTPFIFLVLLAAVESCSRDHVEAARIDGAGGWQVFRDITWPTIAPVAATVVLIRLIEAFKIIDLPNVLTNGGPGIATESLTLHAFIAWRTQNLGGSAAIGYLLLFVAVIVCVSFFNLVTRHTRKHEREAA
ncbi:MAG: carbohydrate ABC transporter permease [Alphaproteobacteria bacterium]